MLARLQQFITVVVVLFSLGWAIAAVRSGHVLWAPGGLLMVSCIYAGVLGLEFLMMRAVHRDDPTPRASSGQVLRAWAAESLHGPLLFCWRQPFRSQAVPDHLPVPSTGRGVVLVHGFVCNRGVWARWLPRLRSGGVPFIAVDLEPVFGSVDDYAPLIDAAVSKLTMSTGMAPVIVAHSMGGLAVRAWMAACAADDRVHHVVTIGSPHHGTWLGRFAHTVNGMQMSIDNAWLLTLQGNEPAKRATRFTCFYSHCDNIVFPPQRACLAGADNRHLPGWPHVRMVEHPDVFETALARLR